MKKALVLAGGLPQIALIQLLQERGYYVLLADWNVEPVAKKYCDEYFQVSTLDVEAIERIAKEEKVQFVITVCTDQALNTVAKVSEDLGLPCYIDYQTAQNVTNKQFMKKVLFENGIPTAKHIVVDRYQEEDYRNWAFPLIVKPVDCNSSKGVKKVQNTYELKEAVEEAIGYSRTKTAIVEDFIEGKEISVDAMIIQGKAKILNTSYLDKLPDDDKFIIFRSTSPAVPNGIVYDRIGSVCQKIADAFHLTNSPLLVQMIVSGNQAYVLEFSARTGGGEKFITIKEMVNYDVVKAVVDLTEGKELEEVLCERSDLICSAEFIYCYPGVYDHIENSEQLISAGVLTHLMEFKWKGAEFDSIGSSGDRVAGFILTGRDYEELNQKHDKVLAALKVVAANGEDLMRRDLLPGFDV